MNPTEQRWRHTSILGVQQQLDVVQTICEAVDAKIADLAKVVEYQATKLGDTRRLVIALQKVGDERWLANSAAQKRLFDRWAAYDAMTFWHRLRWLFRGV